MTLLVVVVAGFWLAIFGVFFLAQGVKVSDLWRGPLEPLPENLNQWREAPERSDEQLLAEERYLLPEGQGEEKLLLQVRYRDRQTQQVVRVEPERVVPRARVRHHK